MPDHEPIPIIQQEGSFHVYLRQNDLIALHALNNWLCGWEAGVGTRVPGHFELIMLLRNIKAELDKSKGS